MLVGTLQLGINFDVLPISRTSKSQLWPILLSIINCDELSKYVIPIEMFNGMKKPSCDVSMNFYKHF